MMLSVEDNERLTRIGPGTPGGEMMRRYWQPALLSEEIPENDCPPVRVRLLCEDLIAFRDTEGRPGLVEAFCPHRRAPLFLGRNEECGIRCVYHGWKFDVQGNCVDMPSEPEGTTLKDKVKLKAYPTFEAGGVVWAYMGPKEKQPDPPNQEWLRAAESHRFVSKTFEACNYLQGLEGGLDTAHSSFVHNNKIGDGSETRNRDRSPKIEIEHTDYGYWYASIRKISDDENYVRVNHFAMPNVQLRGGTTKSTGERAEVPKLDGHIWVPIDDETTYVYNWACAIDDTILVPDNFWEEWESFAGRGKEDLIPGTYRLKQNPSNDHLIDRELQKTSTYTGIKGLNTQDFALQEGMGPIVDRSREFLGTSDRAIIMMRRLMLAAISAVADGEDPLGADPKSVEQVRGWDSVVSSNRPWQEQLDGQLTAKW